MNASRQLLRAARAPSAGVWRLALVGILLLALAGCKSGRIANDIDTTQENDMGKQYSVQIDTHTRLVMDGKINRRIQTVAEPVFLQAMKDRPDVSYRIRVIDDPQVNAFSLPGGYIYIYRGLLDKLGADDEALACVIAHEAAHVVRRHVAKQISDATGKGTIVEALGLLTRSANIYNASGLLYELDQLHFSREDEYEADRWGEKFAYNAGYDPVGMVRTFQILERLERRQGAPAPYSQDHPMNRNRALRALEQLRELRVNGGQYVSVAYDPEGDKTAAKNHGVSYAALVLATTPVAPAGPDLETRPTSGPASARNDPPRNPNHVPPVDAIPTPDGTGSPGPERGLHR